MFKFFILFFLFSSSQLWAKNIVLISALPTKELKTTNQLQNIFKARMAHLPFNIVIIDQGSALELYEHLNSPETFALFWVGHGGFKNLGRRANLSIKASPILFDYNRDNIANVFKRIHPNIKFTTIIGCNSAQILDGVFMARSDLHTYIPTKKVIATRSLKRAINNFLYHFQQDQIEFLQSDQISLGIPVKITRSIKGPGKSLLVFSGPKLIGMLPASNTPMIQEEIFYLPFTENAKASDYKIILSTGHDALDTTDYFGELIITPIARGQWKIFARPDGIPFGTNERIFVFKDLITNMIGENYILYRSH